MHALRHFCASVWIEADFSPKRVQTMMGHASIQLTFDTYGYLFEARMNVTKATDRAEAIVMVDSVSRTIGEDEMMEHLLSLVQFGYRQELRRKRCRVFDKLAIDYTTFDFSPRIRPWNASSARRTN